MRRWLAIGFCGLVACSALLLVLSPRAAHPRGLTWLALTDAENGRRIFAGALSDGEEIVLTWKPSLFTLSVTEVFAAAAGGLDLTAVTFPDPDGRPPPAATLEDLDQPWIVHPQVSWTEKGDLVVSPDGVVDYDESLGLRTADAVSPSVEASQVLASIVGFGGSSTSRCSRPGSMCWTPRSGTVRSRWSRPELRAARTSSRRRRGCKITRAR